MPEDRARSPDRKLGLIGPAAIAIVVLLIIAAALLFQNRSEPAPAHVPPPPAAPPPPSPPPAETVLNRSELLKEAGAIAAAYAGDGDAPAEGKDPLAGRRFEIRIPFGCEGPQAGPGAAQTFYEFDPEKRTVRLVARPAVWTTLPMIQELEAADIEAVEGFWVPHPWSYAEACPKRSEKPVPAAPTPPAAQTLGLARLFEAGGSRVQRRGERPFEHVMKLREDERRPLAEGYRLVLAGRVSSFPTGRVARCWSESPDHRPVCLYAVEFDRVAFESGKDGRLIAEWRE